MAGLVMANVGHWQNTSGSTVNSITADRHCTLANAGVYSENLVEIDKAMSSAVV